MTFYELMKGSTIMQGIATVIVLGADAYLVCTGQPVPELMAITTGAIIGFWFGSKVPYNVAKSSGQ